MPDYTDKQIDRAMDAFRAEMGVTRKPDDLLRREHRAAFRAALAALDATDPGLVTWTPDDGPLNNALRDLPDGHPVTIRGDWGELNGTTVDKNGGIRVAFRDNSDRFESTYFSVLSKRYHTILSASWRRPAPAWDGALAVARRDGVVCCRLTDGTYTYGVGSGWDYYTPAELEKRWGPITVLIDADGQHVRGDHE